MSNSRLLKLAEQLRSDCVAHRELASLKIQQSTGMTIHAIIKKGVRQCAPVETRNSILDNINLYSDDEAVQFVTDKIAGLSNVTWPDIVSAGAGVTPSPTMKSQGVTWQDIMNTEFWNMGPASKPAPKPAAPRERRVLKDELPSYGVGIPRVEMTGTARNGSPYAKVSFSTIAAYGETMKPMCTFMAFGEKWVSELVKAGNSALPISFTIEPAKNPNFDPTLRKAA